MCLDYNRLLPHIRGQQRHDFPYGKTHKFRHSDPKETIAENPKIPVSSMFAAGMTEIDKGFLQFWGSI